MASIARTAPVSIASTKDIVRFDINQRIQHILMMSSFIILAITGIPLKFSEMGLSQWWIGVWGGIDVTRTVHHFFAWVMIADCVYHVIWIAFSVVLLRKPLPVAIIPSLKDFKDFYKELGFFFGLKVERPKYDRFNWREKFDYWAIFWGMFIIGGSGFIMMYPVLVTRYLPGWLVPAALIAHGDEAMLAVVWIAIVHIFFNHFSPVSFPMNKSIFTGRVPVEQYREEHPLEYDRLHKTATLETAAKAAVRPNAGGTTTPTDKSDRV